LALWKEVLMDLRMLDPLLTMFPLEPAMLSAGALVQKETLRMLEPLTMLQSEPAMLRAGPKQLWTGRWKDALMDLRKDQLKGFPAIKLHRGAFKQNKDNKSANRVTAVKHKSHWFFGNANPCHPGHFVTWHTDHLNTYIELVLYLEALFEMS
jgi:hypothetical protein